MLPFPDCPDPSRTVSNKYERKPEYLIIEICDMLDVYTIAFKKENKIYIRSDQQLMGRHATNRPLQSSKHARKV